MMIEVTELLKGMRIAIVPAACAANDTYLPHFPTLAGNTRTAASYDGRALASMRERAQPFF
ncbi:MAG: hypothetical protein AB8B64_08815 [Granulosicoccus sp.]